MALKVYAVKWTDGTMTMVFAQNKIQAASFLDELGDPAGEVVYEVSEDQMVGLMLEAKPVIRSYETGDIVNESPSVDEVNQMLTQNSDEEIGLEYEYHLSGESAYEFENYSTFNENLERKGTRVKIKSSDAY